MLNEPNNIAFSLFDSMQRCMHENIVQEKWLGTDLIINSKNKVIKYFIWTRVPTSIFSTKKKKNYYFKKISYSLTRISIRLQMSFCNSLLYIAISKVVKIGPDRTVELD